MLGLRTTIYKVPDLSAAKDWYAEAFQTLPYFNEPYYIGFNIGGYELGLQPTDDSVSTGQNILSYWGVKDIEREYKRLIKHGATSHEPPTNVGGMIKVATVTDSWDNLIGLIYNPEFKTT